MKSFLLFLILVSLLCIIHCDSFVPKTRRELTEHPSLNSHENFEEFPHVLDPQDFLLKGSFYLQFHKFKVKIELTFFYNRFGELDFEYTPKHEELVLFARNFRRYKAAHSFLHQTVNNIAYQFLTDTLKLTQNSPLVKAIPSTFLFVALKKMMEFSNTIVRYDFQASTYFNRVFSIQFKYLLENGLRGNNEIKLVASINSAQIVRFLSHHLAKNAKNKELNGLIEYFRAFKNKAEHQPRIFTETPVNPKLETSSDKKKVKDLMRTLKKSKISTNIKALFKAHQKSRLINYNWLEDIERRANSSLRKFIDDEFAQISISETFETYAIQNLNPHVGKRQRVRGH